MLTPGQLAEYGVNVSAFPAFQALHEGETFTRIEKFIPDASSRFSFANQRLTLSIPQAAMNVQSRGYVDPSRWDDGVPAAFVDYYFSGAQIKNADEGESSRSNYLNLRSGLNLGAWRLRNISSMQYDQQRRHWDTQSTWLQRDVRSLKSLLRIGDTYTTGDVFDSIQFRGVQLMSDDEMLPDSQRGFAPTIRGVAHSNAKVTVSQHGYVIYETFVSPGAFAISDLYPTSQSGDLEVKVTESNGAVRTFTQPYSAVPYMLREGRGKFSLSAGRYHSGGVGALAGISAGHFVLRFDGGIHPLRWYAAGPGLSGVGAGPGPRFWRVRIAGRMSPRPSPVRRRASAIRAIRCALSIRKILSARALRSASPAIATRQAAITILPKPAPLKAPRASRQPASPGRAVGVAKP